MLTKMKRLFVLVIMAAFAFILVGCASDESKIKDALNKLNVPASVNEDFALPNVSLANASVTWTSDNDAIVISGTMAEVFRTSEDVNVKLTANGTLGSAKATKEFIVKVEKLPAPDTIVITNKGLTEVEYEEEGTMKTVLVAAIGKEIKLNVDFGADLVTEELTWNSSNAKRATVSEDGVLKGLSVGSVTITATSKGVKADGTFASSNIKILINESTNCAAVNLAVKKRILAEMPEFVSEDFTLPEGGNSTVQVKYYDSTKTNEIYDGEYVWVEGVDRKDIVKCVLTCYGIVEEFDIPIRIVTDPENNEFLALAYTEEKLNEALAEYVGTGSKAISGNFDLRNAFPAAEALFDCAVSFSATSSYQPAPVSFVVGEEDKLGTTELVFTKPSDDADVTISAYIEAQNVRQEVKFRVVAGGYTQAEKMEYIKANVLPQAVDGKFELVGRHLTLPASDLTGKFTGFSIAWASSNEEVLSAAGKFVNPYLDADTNVKLTATVTYAGTVDSSFGFTESVELDYVVKPATNTAQAVALELSGYLETEEFLNAVKYFPFGDSTRTDSEGNITNVLPLPKTVSEVTTEHMTDRQELAITWSVNEEGLLDENYKLLKQYLRYHEVVLTYAVTIGEDTATNEITINVGVAEVPNTYYIGGWFNIDQSGGGNNTGDVLCALSKFDKPVGTVSSRSLYWGTNIYGERAAFGGYTYYIDEEVDGVVTRYQFFVQQATIARLDEDYSFGAETAPTDEGIYSTALGNGKFMTMDKEKQAAIVTHFGGNWGLFFVNETDHDIVVPMTPYTGGGTPFKDADGVDVKWVTPGFNKANVVDRENGFGYDGYRVGFATDGTGKVVFGNGNTVIQAAMDLNGNNEMDDTDYLVTIPAHGYGMTYKTMYNNASVCGRFCAKDAQLTVKYFEPYHLSVDGSKDGLGTFKHE